VAKVIVYTTNPCGYCVMAKNLLKKKGVDFEERMVFAGTPDWDEMMSLTGGKTVPQVLIDGRVIGGLPDLLRLEESGELDLLV
jgi:glutaredoxin 3